VDSDYLFQDRDRQWVVVNTVMNFHVEKKRPGMFSNNVTIVSFFRSIVLS
jgi:hypothetical protein